MYRATQMMCRDLGGTVVSFLRNYVYGRRKNVHHGPDMAGNWSLNGARGCQRWWISSWHHPFCAAICRRADGRVPTD